MATTEFSAAALERALDNASAEIKREVASLVDRYATLAKSRVQAVYPIGPTGQLHNRVTVSYPRGTATSATGTIIPARVVRASAPHVHIWQEGTVERFDATRGNARRGRSPAHGKKFEAIAADTRTEMLHAAFTLINQQREL